MTEIFPLCLFIDILLQMLRRPPRLYVQWPKIEVVSLYVMGMKNCWPYFLLSVLLVNAFGPVVAKTNDNDTDGQRVNRRAELRSALSVPLPPTGPAEENVKKNMLHEHQLSAQQRVDLRRQLREQFRALGLEASP
jgi:hypothetical protein